MTKGWKIAAVAVVVGVATYVGLEILAPHHKAEVRMSGLVPTDSVFGDTLKSPEEVASAAAADDSALTPSGPAVATDDAMAAPADDGGDQEAMVDTTAPEHGDMATATDTETASDEQATAAPAEAAPPAPPVTKPAAKPVEASKPSSKPAESTKPAKAASKPAATETAGKSSKSWWVSSGNSQGLHVIYAGSAAFERAIVVMGNAPFASAASANQNIRVSDTSGKAVAGSWKLGASNKSMLVFPVGKSGTFTVSVGAGLSDAQNRKLGQPVKGPVAVQ